MAPDRGVGYAVVINTDNPTLLRVLERIIERSLIDGRPATKLPSELPFSCDDGVAGAYHRVTARFGDWRQGAGSRLALRCEDGGLVVHYRNRASRWRHVGGRRFAPPKAIEPTAALVTDEAGDTYFVGELGNFVRTPEPKVSR